jgi:hypothetical protein
MDIYEFIVGFIDSTIFVRHFTITAIISAIVPVVSTQHHVCSFGAKEISV